MGDLTGLYSACQGLMTHGTALNAVADNIANSNTTGYKTERVEFGDLIAESSGCLMGAPLSPGNGSLAVDITSAQGIQGALEFTGRSLDTAIEGTGYFILNDGTTTAYTRAGNFSTDSTGNLIAEEGGNVMGYTTASPTTLVPLTVSSATGAAVPTTATTVYGNLDASAAAATTTSGFTTWSALNQATTFRSSISIVDSLGETHEISLHFFKTNTSGQTPAWTVSAYVDGADTNGTANTPVSVGGPTTISFDGTGAQAAGATTALSISTPAWTGGASASTINVNLASLTGYAGSSAFSGVTSDGNRAGQMNSLEISEDGQLAAVLDNGDRVIVGTIALASFAAPTELDRIGDNRYVETEGSGTAQSGNPATGGRGILTGGALESSTVDPATEFVSMIRFQRGYQANSKVITTLSEVLSTTIQIA